MTVVRRVITPKAITLNEYLCVPPEALKKAGLLNTVIGADTKLFIDPKLLRNTDIPELSNAIEDIEKYFDELLAVNAQAKFPMAYEKAVSMIAVREPVGLSIGYGDKRDTGTSISRTVAIRALRAITELVRIGFEDEKVMEMLGLYIKNFASDSISDLTAHIIYPHLCAYTERVSNELGLTTYRFAFRSKTYLLPRQNNSHKPIILLPLEILSDLPLATSWSDIAEAAKKNANTRNEFYKFVGSSIKKFEKRIKDNPDLLITSKEAMDLLMTIYDEALVEPYDSAVDNKGYLRLADFAANLNTNQPSSYTRAMSASEMVEFVRNQILETFRFNIESIGANELLYEQTPKGKVLYNKPLHEHAAQTLFHAVAARECNASNILSTRESKVGKGAVDFFIATHPNNKVLVELKKSDNNNLLEGFEKQIEKYMQNEKAAAAFYVVVLVDRNNQRIRTSQFNQLNTLYAEKLRKKEKCPDLVVINGLEQTAPSKLK